MNRDLLAELARRKLIWCYYFEYLVYAYRDSRITGCLLFCCSIHMECSKNSILLERVHNPV